MKKLKMLESWVSGYKEAEDAASEAELLAEFVQLGEADEQEWEKAVHLL